MLYVALGALILFVNLLVLVENIIAMKEKYKIYKLGYFHGVMDALYKASIATHKKPDCFMVFPVQFEEGFIHTDNEAEDGFEVEAIKTETEDL